MPRLPVSVYVLMAISLAAFASGQWLGHHDTKAGDAPASRVATHDTSGLTLLNTSVTVTPPATSPSTTPATPHIAVAITADAEGGGLTADHGKSQPHEHDKGKRHKADHGDGTAHDGTEQDGKTHQRGHEGNQAS
jgi:hypothetical protein